MCAYSLELADSTEFAQYHALYRMATLPLWFPLSIEQSVDILRLSSSSYWVLKDTHRIAGAIIKENYIGFVFLIPPFTDRESVITYLVENAKHNKQVIKTQSDNEDKDIYSRLGFEIIDTGLCMIRPTQQYPIDFDPQYSVSIPRPVDAQDCADLLHFTYKISPVPSLAAESLCFHEKVMQNFFADEESQSISLLCSSLIRNGKTSELIGLCTVGMWEKLPLIRDIVVHPAYHNKGIGSTMLKKAIHNAHSMYWAIRLWAKVGNPAIDLYSRFGFVSGSPLYEMIYKQ